MYTGHCGSHLTGATQARCRKSNRNVTKAGGENSISGGRRNRSEGGTKAGNSTRFLKQQIGLAGWDRGGLLERLENEAGQVGPGLGEPLVLIQSPFVSFILFFLLLLRTVPRVQSSALFLLTIFL